MAEKIDNWISELDKLEEPVHELLKAREDYYHGLDETERNQEGQALYQQTLLSDVCITISPLNRGNKENPRNI